MAVCGLRTLLLAVCILELIVTVQRQVFDFLGYMWLPIIANFINIILIIFGSFGAVQYIVKYLFAVPIFVMRYISKTPSSGVFSLRPVILIIFGSFGAVQYIVKYLFAYAVWSIVWLSWNIFLVCFYLDLGTLKKESDLLSLGTGSVSWWEGNGWGCQPEWGETDGLGSLRPERVEGCLLQWHHVELAQSVIAALLTLAALPLTLLSACHALKGKNNSTDKKTLPRRPVYTIELSPTETAVSETSLKPMTPRRVKRRSGSRGTNSSVRRSRRSYRNAGYHASTTSLPRDPRPSRPPSAHSSYSNFHAARPASYHVPERDLYAPSPVETGYGRAASNPGYDVAGPYGDSPRGQWDTPPPPAPPYSPRATPQAPGPPAYQTHYDNYMLS